MAAFVYADIHAILPTLDLLLFIASYTVLFDMTVSYDQHDQYITSVVFGNVLTTVS